MTFDAAVEDALTQAMAADSRIVIIGEDVPALRRNLAVRYGEKRVRGAPISEAAFVGAAVTAAMAGLRPVVELYMVDFISVAMDALLNHAAKLDVFSGGRWQAPLVVRAPCGGWYGDGGQHEQALWGWLAHIPGLSVVVPSTPADAGGLMLTALQHEGPVIYLEPKLLSVNWIEFLGSGGRETVSYDIPAAGAKGPVPRKWKPLPLGKALVRRKGTDLTMISVGVGVHRALSAAEKLQQEGIEAGVIDLRSVSPLDVETVVAAVGQSRRLLVVDEDYRSFGLSGELAAVVLEAGIAVKYARVCTEQTIPYARHLEEEVLPNVNRIVEAARHLTEG
jgi:pyruvate dehydrogenase E1 component beta subunit